MCSCLVGIQADQDASIALRHSVNAQDHHGGDGGALVHVDAVGQRVGPDGDTVVGADIKVGDVDSALRAARIR